jgi:PAS domain S-box-containing protein
VHAVVAKDIRRPFHELKIHQVELKVYEELHKARVELAALRDRYADLYTDLYESSPLPYVTLDKDGRILESNPLADKILGAERENLLGTNLAKFLTIESLESWHPHRRTGCSNKEKRVCEIRIRRTDGTLLPVRAESIVVGNGSDGHCRTALVDISQQKHAEEEREHFLLREQSVRKELEAATKAKDQFLSIVSHELRTPLTPILCWSSLLRHKRLNKATLNRGLESIERNARRQKRLIDDLLDVSDNIACNIRVNFRPVELPAILNAAIDTVRSSADAKAIQIHTQFDEDARLVSGDPKGLQRVIFNVLSNAVKFTPAGGRINAQLRRVSSHIQIVVSDTGIGIPKNFLPYVFAPFSQADNTNLRAQRGLGLGLAIVHQIVEMHGGTAQVRSKQGKGATFTIRLPLKNVRAIEDVSVAPGKDCRVHSLTSSAYARAPKNDNNPVPIQTSRIIPVAGRLCATELGTRKIAEPITVPTTIAAASSMPSARGSSCLDMVTFKFFVASVYRGNPSLAQQAEDWDRHSRSYRPFPRGGILRYQRRRSSQHCRL